MTDALIGLIIGAQAYFLSGGADSGHDLPPRLLHGCGRHHDAVVLLLAHHAPKAPMTRAAARLVACLEVAALCGLIFSLLARLGGAWPPWQWVVSVALGNAVLEWVSQRRRDREHRQARIPHVFD